MVVALGGWARRRRVQRVAGRPAAGVSSARGARRRRVQRAAGRPPAGVSSARGPAGGLSSAPCACPRLICSKLPVPAAFAAESSEAVQPNAASKAHIALPPVRVTSCLRRPPPTRCRPPPDHTRHPVRPCVATEPGTFPLPHSPVPYLRSTPPALLPSDSTASQTGSRRLVPRAGLQPEFGPFQAPIPAAFTSESSVRPLGVSVSQHTTSNANGECETFARTTKLVIPVLSHGDAVFPVEHSPGAVTQRRVRCQSAVWIPPRTARVQRYARFGVVHDAWLGAHAKPRTGGWRDARPRGADGRLGDGRKASVGLAVMGSAGRPTSECGVPHIRVQGAPHPSAGRPTSECRAPPLRAGRGYEPPVRPP